MELDGDRVRKVDWFGGDFNDKFVDLLEQVPISRSSVPRLRSYH
jgi:hypothetical protein